MEEGDSLLPVKYTDELEARAVELVIHAQADPDTANGAITRVANELGLSKETLRVWVRKQAHRKRQCRTGLKPPDSSRHLAM